MILPGFFTPINGCRKKKKGRAQLQVMYWHRNINTTARVAIYSFRPEAK